MLAKRDIRHFEASLIYSPDQFGVNNFLVNLFTQAAELAWNSPITGVSNHLKDSIYLNIFPGEHYRLIKAIAQIQKPSLIVEIGTYTGMGSLALMQGQVHGKVITYDIIPWNHFDTHLHQGDFDQNKIEQKLADLADLNEFEKNIEILNQADIIFIDGPKDGKFEYQILPLLSKLEAKENKLLIMDDIRFVNMIDLWISIQSPKLDASSMGHWSGTGLVDISQPLKITT
ncbi:MAG: methyltransferase [Polynucleobacter sp.]|nr:methyltransferase [Polynucleobacter sp.]